MQKGNQETLKSGEATASCKIKLPYVTASSVRLNYHMSQVWCETKVPGYVLMSVTASAGVNETMFVYIYMFQ